MGRYILKECKKIKNFESKVEKRQAFQRLKKSVEKSDDYDKKYLIMLIKEYEETHISDHELASLLEKLNLISR